MTGKTTTKLIFKGVVQGVGFRPTIYRIATQLKSHGYVLNKGSEVEVVIDTNPETFILELKKQLPSLARIDSIEKKSIDASYSSFSIQISTNGSRHSLLPVDTALCNACVQELHDTTNRRYSYPFTNCTVCGARYSVITDVPYDRERTAMQSFPLCSECEKEYTNPLNRRYHAQTISCPSCGPTYTFYEKDDSHGESGANGIKKFTHAIDEGKIGIIKSWGGMHLCCTLEMIDSFRKWYQRPQKSFAVLVKDIKSAQHYAKITESEKNLLLSLQRPIVLVEKKQAENISPGLETIGLFLPYTGIHHILFSSLKTDALIMTSANLPGEPMITENNDAFDLHADVYLLHNRSIPNRVDDSVIKLWKNHTFFIRKSRGYVPDPIPVSYTKQIISVGAGENITGAISTNNLLYPTQYIGNGQYYESIQFLEQSIRHLMKLSMKAPQIDAVAMDIHPGYETRSIAQLFSEEFNVPLLSIQHHWAHAASLLLDNTINEAVVLTLDGLGYGDDETLWGGEVLYSTYSTYHRVGGLKPIPLIGGDTAAADPRRVVFAIFDSFDIPMFFKGKQAEVFRKMMPHAPQSSSLGRVLDALSCFLGICCSRTYDGEPAMKLERYLRLGKPTYAFEVSIQHNQIDTFDLFYQLHKQIKKPLSEKEKANAAYSFVKAIIDSLTHMAITYAKAHHISHVGITGGVSYNIPIVEMVEHLVTKQGLSCIVHEKIPNGDGGISIGQNVISGTKLT